MSPGKHALGGVHIGATWQIPMNRPCAAAMRPVVKLLWPLVTIATYILVKHVEFCSVAKSAKFEAKNKKWYLRKRVPVYKHFSVLFTSEKCASLHVTSISEVYCEFGMNVLS